MNDTSNSRYYLDRLQSRRVDQIAIERFGIPGIVLMENAGRGIADYLVSRAKSDATMRKTILLACGSGNNGGDGYVIARHLFNAGWQVQIASAVDTSKLAGDAKSNCDIAREIGLGVIEHRGDNEEWLKRIAVSVNAFRPEWAVDCLLGTGARLPLNETIRSIVKLLNGIPSRRLAVDLPTGMDCDTGEADADCFQADVTCTMVSYKNAMKQPDALKLCGEIEVMNIGIPNQVIHLARDENFFAN